mmetsp:Transcript_27172/g.54354  ORF Transcript_27172/g.54354 Transcript_27172/m.54354 type:complete len:214 (+) Transcript_27172:207-848(+)
MCLSSAARPQAEFFKHWARVGCTHAGRVPTPVIQLLHGATHHSAGLREWEVGRAPAMFEFGAPLPSMHGATMTTENMMCAFVEQMADKGEFLGGGNTAPRASPKLTYSDGQMAAVQNFMLIEDYNEFYYQRLEFYKKIEKDGKTNEIAGVVLCQQFKRQAMAVAPTAVFVSQTLRRTFLKLDFGAGRIFITPPATTVSPLLPAYTTKNTTCSR